MTGLLLQTALWTTGLLVVLWLLRLRSTRYARKTR